jgi:hypothetical protein
VILEHIRAFLEDNEEVQFEAKHKQRVYDWVERTLGARLEWVGTSESQAGAAISCKYDGTQPTAGYAADPTLQPGRSSQTQIFSAVPVCQPVPPS